MNSSAFPHRSYATRLIFALTLALFLGTSTTAQQYATDGTTPLGLSPGAPAGSYPLSDFENINLFNGSLNFSLPLVKVGGRGSAGYPITLRLNQKWLVDKEFDGEPPANHYYAQPGWWTDFGWAAVYSMGRMEMRQGGTRNFVIDPGCGYVNQQTLTRLTFTAPDGTEYELRDQQTNGQPVAGSCTFYNRGTVFVTSDGSGATFISDAAITDYAFGNPSNIPPSGYMMLRDGTRYRIDNGNVSWIRDHNGNKVVLAYDNFQRVTSVTDSLNRQVTISYQTTPGGYDQITLKGFGGVTRTIKVHFSSLSTSLRSDCSFQTVAQMFPELNGGGGYYDVLVVSSLELPNGQQYQFRYNSYAELARVVLPTGGAFEYDHTAALTDSTTGSGVISGMSDKQIYRRLIERRIYPDGGSGSGYAVRTTYSRPETTSSNLGYVLTDQYNSTGTLLERSKHYFNGSPRASFFKQPTEYPAWSDGREYKTEFYAADGTTLLRKMETAFAQRVSVSWWTGGSATEPPNDTRRSDTTTTLSDTNQVTKETFGYDDTVPFNNENNRKEYDFGNGAAGALLRETRTTFLTSASYTGATVHLRSLPTQVSVYDGSGVERARTTLEYDNYVSDTNHAALTNRISISGFDSIFNTSYTTRGNVTAVTSYLLSGGTVTGSVSSYSQYDIAGNVVKAIDARGSAVTFFYSDCFGTPNGEARTNSSPAELGALSSFAYVTKITNALNQSSYVQFDYYLGRPVDGEDVNGIIGSGYFNDSLDRPTQLQRAVGTALANQTTYSYDDTNRSITTSSDRDVNNDNLLITKVLYDQMGRVTEKQQFEGGTNYVTMQTQYDTLGRDYKTSNPFRPWQSETAIWTTRIFDALGRVVSVTTPDNAVLTTSYTGNSSTVTDQTGKARRSITDALGRLLEVYEDPNGLNYQTTYVYDVLDDLVKVTQGTQQRFFMYDSLKRLIRARNPEQSTNSNLSLTDPLTSNSAWSIGYQYDSSGNLLIKTDPRDVSAHFEYDALNRNTRRWYNGSSSTSQTTHNNPVLPSGVGATDETKFYYDTQALPSGAPSYSHGSAVGRLVAQVYGTGSNGDYYAYDGLGRPTLKYQQIGAINYQLGAAYNLSSEITTLTVPSGHTVTSTYDTAGRLTAVSGNLGDGTNRTYATGILYSPFGGLTKEQFGTTTPVYNKLFYNSRGQLAEIRESTSYTGPTDTTWNRGAIINHYSEQCWGMCGGNNSTSSMTDNNGNLRKQGVYIPNDDQVSGYTERWQQYDYDSLNRLNWVREIKDNVEQWKQQFTYDRWGNRTINTGVTYGVGINNKAFNVDTATNRLTVPTGQSGVMTYDLAGNLTNDTYTAAGNRTYDGENKISSATGSSTQTEVYAYDASGQRIKRTVDGVTTWQIYGLAGELVAEYAANGAVASPQKEYGYRNGQLLVTAEPATGPQNVTWTNATGVSISGNSLTKTAPDDWYNARASSTQSLTAGDGYVEFTASETSTYRMTGLGEAGTGSFNYSNLRYMFYVAASGTLYADEYGTLHNVGTYATGDTLRVGIEAGVVKYRKNGTVVYTSSLAPVYPLYADATLYTNGSTLSNVKFSSGSGGTGAKIQWLISDQLGTPRMVLDETGSLANVKRHDYLPFGEELFAPTSGRLATQGYVSGDGVRQQFTSQERDRETALDYFGVRFYSNLQARFVSPDEPFADVDEDDPQSWNLYAYVRNNPLRFVDPMGDARWEVADDGIPHYVGDFIGEYDKDLNATWDGRTWNFHEDNGLDNTVVAGPEPVNNEGRQNETAQMTAVGIALAVAPPPVKIGLGVGAIGGAIIVGGVLLFHEPVTIEIAPPRVTPIQYVRPKKIDIGPAPPPPPMLKKKGERRQIRAAARAAGVSYIALRNAIHKYKREMKMRGNENLDWETLVAIAEQIKKRLEDKK